MYDKLLERILEVKGAGEDLDIDAIEQRAAAEEKRRSIVPISGYKDCTEKVLVGHLLSESEWQRIF